MSERHQVRPDVDWMPRTSATGRLGVTFWPWPRARHSATQRHDTTCDANSRLLEQL
jgi:hypothetical protein